MEVHGMATSPFRLSSAVVAVLRKLSDISGLSMADWVRNRIRSEEAELNTRVQPVADHPSLIRDVWAFGRTLADGRHALKEKILEGLKGGIYDPNEIGIDRLTPLHWAMRGWPDVEVVEAILDKVHDPSPRDSYGITPLVMAVRGQDPKLESNLSIIQLLLTRSKDEDLMVKPSIFGLNQGIFDYAESCGMRGTLTLVRERFQRFDLEVWIGKQELTIHEMAEGIAQVRYYQGRAWRSIAEELRTRGFERSIIWYHLNRLGAWSSFLEELKIRGEADTECVGALLELGATWPDIAWAYVKNGYPSEEIVSTLYPLLQKEDSSKGILSWMVAGSIAPDRKEDLRAVRQVLEDHGEDPRAIVAGMPYVPERKARILERMGLPTTS